jgi:cytochrome P450
MSRTAEKPKIHFDPLDGHTASDPYPTYALLRQSAPVYYDEEHDFWALSRYEDVRAASQDWETFSNSQGVDLDDGDELFGASGGDFLACDPPKHDLLRGIVQHHFAPREIAQFEDVIRSRVELLIDEVRSDSVIDAAQVFAKTVPVHTMGRLLGFPETEDETIRAFVTDVMLRVPGERAVPAAARAAAQGLREYLADESLLREAAAGSELTRTLLDAVEDGRITQAELLDIIGLVTVAGISTSSGTFGYMLLRLAEYPEQQTALREDVSLVPRAVEEALRFDSTAQWSKRVTTRAVDVQGVRIPKGSRVLLLWGSANRDERKFENPDVFDVRRPVQRHLAFANGIHHCLGAPLARLEGRVLVEALIRRTSGFELAGPPEHLYSASERVLSALPLRLDWT